MQQRYERVPRRRAGETARPARGAAASDGATPAVVQPRAADAGYELLDGHDFRNAVSAHLARNRDGCFTIVIVRPDQPAARSLAQVLFETLRMASGDLVGDLGGAIGLYVHGARRAEVDSVLKRVRERWQLAQGGDLAIDVADHPCDEYRVVDLLAANWSEDEASLGRSN